MGPRDVKRATVHDDGDFVFGIGKEEFEGLDG
jgi:hypothetical protein